MTTPEPTYCDDVTRDLWKMLDREIEIMISLASSEGAEYPRSTIEDLRDAANRFAAATARALTATPPPNGVDNVHHLVAHAAEFARIAGEFHVSKGPR
jgi:hypothetical protein